MIAQESSMKKIYINKLILHISVGQAGERLERAKSVLRELSGQEPKELKAKKTLRDFGIHKGEKIACMVTVRKAAAVQLLQRVVQAKNSTVNISSVDQRGNLAFGIREHIDIPGVKYDPEIGIYGMDVMVNLSMPVLRVEERKRLKSRIGAGQKVTREQAIEFYRGLGVNLV
jgi:large subunit ribosomal protein L5